MKKPSILCIALLVAGSLLAQTKWEVDKAHSKISFLATHMMVAEVEGQFQDFSASIASPAEDFTGADVEFVAKVASIDTDNERRDNHLKSDDFFNAEEFPEVKFKGKLVKEGGKYYLKGDFTMRDVTKQVTFDVAYGGQVKAGNGTKAGFKVTGTVDRTEFGLKWNQALEAGGWAVSPEIDIVCRIELNKVA